MNDLIILRERIITLSPGETFDQALQGNVLRVTAGNVPLRIQGRAGQMDFSLEAGERAEFPGEFPGLILSHVSGVAQTFTIQVGKGVNVASAKVNGVVTISGTPNINVINSVKTTNEGVSYGASFRSSVALASNTPQTVFTAATNLNGAIIHAAQFIEWSSGASFCNGAFLAKSTAPTHINDGDVILGADTINNTVVTTASSNDAGSLKNPIRIPAGKGLFFIANAGQTESSRSVLYTLL